MALIAKKILRIGFTVVALPGNIVPPEAVAEYGWQDDVEDDGNGPVGGSDAEAEPETKTRRGRKAAAAE